MREGVYPTIRTVYPKLLHETRAGVYCIFKEGKPMVSLEHVGKFILKDVDIYIPEGEAVGIIGATGAGKTTFLKLVCGLLKPDGGWVHTLGVNPIKARKQIGRQMGVLFADKPILRDEESVLENFRSLQIIHGLSEECFTREYDALSTRLGFKAWERQKVKNLSLGQRRRAELGAVLLHEPKLLLLDEPMNGLDADARAALRDIVEERRSRGMTLLVTSHNMEDISRLCRRLAVLHEGRLLYYGGEEGLLRRYAPMDVMSLKIQGKLPDMTDLPLQKYTIDNDKLTLTYDSNHISSAEILRCLLAECTIKEVNVRKSALSDAILRIERGERYEQFD